MTKTSVYSLLVAAIAVGGALFYRQQVFQQNSPPSTVRVAFITGGAGPYWELTTLGAKEAAEKYDCELTIEMPEQEESLDEQMKLIAAIETDELDGLALSPLDAEGQTQLINRLQQKIHVATYDSDAPLSTRRIHIGTSNYGAGKLCAQLVGEAIPEGGKVLVLLANLAKENMVDRKMGFEDAIKTSQDGESDPPQLEVVDYKTDSGSTETIIANINNALEEHPDLKCIVGMNAMHANLILSVLKDAEKIGDVKIVAFDEEKETLNGIEVGHVYATVAQDPYKYGYEAVRMLSSLCRNGSSEVPIVGGGTIYIAGRSNPKGRLE